MHVVYFDKRLGAGHSKHWSNYVFSMFLYQNAELGENSKKIDAKFIKKNIFEQAWAVILMELRIHFSGIGVLG